MFRRIIGSSPCVGMVTSLWLAVLMLSAVNQASAGPQHWGFGMSYLATLKPMDGRTNLVVYEGPLRAKNGAWIPRWIDRTTDFSSVVPGGMAIGDFWPSDPGKEYLAVVSQKGQAVTIRTLDPPERFMVGQWAPKNTSTITLASGSVIATATGDLLGQKKDQLVLLVQDKSALEVVVLTAPIIREASSTYSERRKADFNWTVAAQADMPKQAGEFRGFAVGDFWGEGKGVHEIALATSKGGKTTLSFYSLDAKTGKISLITTDSAKDLPALVKNGLVASDYVKDKFDVLTLFPTNGKKPFQIRVAPTKTPNTPFNPGQHYTGDAISRQHLPGNGGKSSLLCMTGTFSDGGKRPVTVAAGRLFGYLVEVPNKPLEVNTASDAEIVYTHRTPIKGDRPPYGWPAKNEKTTWEIALKNNGSNTIPPGGATLKIWLNTPYRNADTNPATCDKPDYTIPVKEGLPPFDPTKPRESYVKYDVSCPWPYDLIPVTPGAEYKKLNLTQVGERWLVVSMDCASDTILRNNRYEAMIAAQTFHPSFTLDSFSIHRGPGVAGDPSSYEYIYSKLADAEVCMFERSRTHDNEDVLQRPYFDGFEIPIPENFPPAEQSARWKWMSDNYEGWRSQSGSRADMGQSWVRFDWADGGAELHEVGHLYHPLGDLYPYYAFPTTTGLAKMADGTPVQLWTCCWYPDSFSSGSAVINEAACEYMKHFTEGTRQNGLPPPDSNWCDVIPDRVFVRILDRDGKPVPNSEVTLWTYGQTKPFATGKTGPDGKWEITDLFGPAKTNVMGLKVHLGYSNNGLTYTLADIFTVKIGNYQDCSILGMDEPMSHSRLTLLFHRFIDPDGWTWDFKTNYKPGAPEPKFKAEASCQGFKVELGITGTPGATYRVYRRWEPTYPRVLVGEFKSKDAYLKVPQDLKEPDSHMGGRYRAIYEITEVTPEGESLPRTMSVVGLRFVRGISTEQDGKLLVAENMGNAQGWCEEFDGTTPVCELFFHARFGHTAMKVVRSRMNPGNYYADLLGSDMPWLPDYTFDLMQPPNAADGSSTYDAHLYIGTFSVTDHTTTAPYTMKLSDPKYSSMIHAGDRVRDTADIISVVGDTVTTDKPVFKDEAKGGSFVADRFAGRTGTRAEARELKNPRGMDVLAQGGNEYVAIADGGNKRVVIWDDKTGYVTHYQFTDPDSNPAGIATYPGSENKFFLIDRHADRNSKLYLFDFDGKGLTVEPGYPVSVSVGDYGNGLTPADWWREMGLAAAVDPATAGIVLAITDGTAKQAIEMRQVDGRWKTTATYTQAVGTFVGSADLQGPLDAAYVTDKTGLSLYVTDMTVSNEYADRVLKLH